MAKTPRKNSKKEDDKKQRGHDRAEKSRENEDTENKYGGFPDRDLKKNLGCG